MHTRFAYRMTLLAKAAVAAILIFPISAAWATESEVLQSSADRCEALQSVDFASTPDAPTQIVKVAAVADTDSAPTHCRVQGYVAPQVGFELLLPLADWNGKFIFQGCGALCGSTWAVTHCNAVLRRGYACMASDGGHRSPGDKGLWAYNNLQAEVDYGFRGVHVATLAGKAITEHYYGTAPKYSFFLGGSNGGREGLIQAQRFPWNYNGVALVNPTINHMFKIMTLLWDVVAVTDEAGKPLFTTADLDVLHAAVIAKCDRDDGLTDGIIGDPRTCEFDPAELQCVATQRVGCLSQRQVAAARKVYSGPVTSTGEKLFFGAMPGSEKGELSFALAQPNGQTGVNLAKSVLRYVFFAPDAGPELDLEDFDFDADYKRLGLAVSLYDASNPDLRKFKAAGGKLIILQGWDDSGLTGPLETIDYYETVERTVGGRPGAQEFVRLFMVPGMAHDFDGPGPNTFDLLSYLEAWVERGDAPTMMMGAHVEGKASERRYTGADLNREKVKFIRPVYPYPLQARYRGVGDPNDYRNFEPVEPETR